MPEEKKNQQAWKPSVNPWIIALAVILPAFMEVIDTSIAAVCIPYIAGSLSASSDEATWVLTFYLLSNAVVLPASAWFSLRFGRKRFLLASIFIFTVASFLCGAANSLMTIILARLVHEPAAGHFNHSHSRSSPRVFPRRSGAWPWDYLGWASWSLRF